MVRTPAAKERKKREEKKGQAPEYYKERKGIKTFRINLPGQVQAIRVGKISVGGRHGEHNGIFLGNELEAHVSDLEFNVLGLSLNGHLGHARQINQGQIQHTRRVDLQINGDGRHSCTQRHTILSTIAGHN